jgi:uncharacterized protein (DUF433 family)
MAVAATSYQHIAIDDDGVPQIVDANTKVVEIVGLVRFHSLSPEQIHRELPHLTLGQIHSALAYYWDHQSEVDADLDRRRQLAERLRHEMGQPPIVEAFKQRGLI